MISPEILENRQYVSGGLQQPYLVLKNALIPEVAEALYQELSGITDWVREDQEAIREVTDKAAVRQADEYRFKRNYIDLNSDDAPPHMRALCAYLRSRECLDWISDVSGRVSNHFRGRAAYFDAGDNISHHNDYYVHHTDDNKTIARTVTFNYYLTRDWKEEWGGNFVWEKPYKKIVPAFNTLVMFLVGPGSMHHVDPVVTEAAMKRLAITGWFLSIRDSDKVRRELDLGYIK